MSAFTNVGIGHTTVNSKLRFKPNLTFTVQMDDWLCHTEGPKEFTTGKGKEKGFRVVLKKSPYVSEARSQEFSEFN